MFMLWTRVRGITTPSLIGRSVCPIDRRNGPGSSLPLESCPVTKPHPYHRRPGTVSHSSARELVAVIGDGLPDGDHVAGGMASRVIMTPSASPGTYRAASS